jgi:hypothetical protein
LHQLLPVVNIYFFPLRQTPEHFFYPSLEFVYRLIVTPPPPRKRMESDFFPTIPAQLRAAVTLPTQWDIHGRLTLDHASNSADDSDAQSHLFRIDVLEIVVEYLFIASSHDMKC